MRATKTLLWLAASLSIVCADGLEDELSGFDESGTDEVVLAANDSASKHSTIPFSGYLEQEVGYFLNDVQSPNSLSSLRSALFLDLDMHFEQKKRLKINAKAYYDALYDGNRADYNEAVLEQFAWEAELYDAYFEGAINDALDYKIGRQVVVWGRSDTLRVVDVLNALDNRRPGMVDIEDLRLPEAMVKLDWYYQDWHISPMLILEHRANKIAPYGSDYSFMPMAMPKQENSAHATDSAVAIERGFDGGDVSLYAAHYHDHTSRLNRQTNQSSFDEIDFVGVAANYLAGSWLFKGEYAYKDGFSYARNSSKQYATSEMLLGFEYKGFSDTTISYDAKLSYLHKHNKALAMGLFEEQKQYAHALRVQSDCLHSTLHLGYLVALYGKKLDQGGYQRIWAKYDIDDNMQIEAGYIDYLGGSELFDRLKQSDQLFAKLRYSF